MSFDLLLAGGEIVFPNMGVRTGSTDGFAARTSQERTTFSWCKSAMGHQ